MRPRHRMEWVMGVVLIIVSTLSALTVTLVTLRERTVRSAYVPTAFTLAEPLPGKPVGTDTLTKGTCVSYYPDCCTSSFPGCAT